MLKPKAFSAKSSNQSLISGNKVSNVSIHKSCKSISLPIHALTKAIQIVVEEKYDLENPDMWNWETSDKHFHSANGEKSFSALLYEKKVVD